MSSILSNIAARTALSNLRNANKGLENTQDRISTGLKVRSAKDGAALFNISQRMGSDSDMNKAINDSLTLTRNAVSVGRTGAEAVMELTQEIAAKIAFAKVEYDRDPDYDMGPIQREVDAIVEQVDTVISQSSFNGVTMVDGLGNQHWDSTDGLPTGLDPTTPRRTSSRDYDIRADENEFGYNPEIDPDNIRIVSGITRNGAELASTTMTVEKVDLISLKEALERIDLSRDNPNATSSIKGGINFYAGDDRLNFYLDLVNVAIGMATDAATSLGISEKAIERQQEFLTGLTDRLDSGVGALIDADMEEEAARLQALQVQQQLASQSLSIANQSPQQILSLFK